MVEAKQKADNRTTVNSARPSVWSATSLIPSQTTAVAAELMRFVTTPRAIQAILSGSGANIGHFQPKVHITLWN